MQMKTRSRWGSGASRYKSRSLSRKETRQAESSQAHRAEQWPKLCRVWSSLRLEQSDRGTNKPRALFPIYVLARYWCPWLGDNNIKKRKCDNWVLLSDLVVPKSPSSQKERTSRSCNSSLGSVSIVWSVQEKRTCSFSGSKDTDRQEDDLSPVLRRRGTHWDLGGFINQKQ